MRKSLAPRLNLSCAADASRRLVYVLDLDKLKPRNPNFVVRKGGSGFGISEKNVMYTIDATIVNAVAICPAAPSERKL